MQLFSSAVLAGLATLQAETAAPDRYVPSSGWRNNEWAAGFYEAWYGKQLRAMNEKPLPLEAGIGRRFRLLVVPNSQPAFAIRIDFQSDGVASLRWVELDGLGGYAPGKIRQEGRRMLTPIESRRITASLGEAGLGSLSRERSAELVTTNRDGSQTLTFCHHATHFVFEEFGASGHHYVQREICWVEDALDKLRRDLLRLAASGSTRMQNRRRRWK
jgi:hypothetical protein